MASAITHGLVGLSFGLASRRRSTRRLWLLGTVCAVLPDADVLMHLLVEYEHAFGHRGAFHSPAFYLVFSLVVANLWPDREERPRVFFLAFLSLLSHSFLDMMTTGGLGVAALFPISSERFFLPWRPIPVSPISVKAFFTQRGLDILSVELRFAIPMLISALLFRFAGRRGKRSTGDGLDDRDAPQSE